MRINFNPLTTQKTKLKVNLNIAKGALLREKLNVNLSIKLNALKSLASGVLFARC